MERDLTRSKCHAGSAMLYQACSRLELMQLYTSWREGEAQRSSDIQLHRNSLPRHEKGEQLVQNFLGEKSRSAFKFSSYPY